MIANGLKSQAAKVRDSPSGSADLARKMGGTERHSGHRIMMMMMMMMTDGFIERCLPEGFLNAIIP